MLLWFIRSVRCVRRTAVLRVALPLPLPLLSLAPAPAAAQGVATRGAAAHGVVQAESRTIAVRGRVEGRDIVRAARRFVGVPYALGGTTPAAFDCSGLVRYVFAEFGVRLPRTAHEQAAVGDAPFPGDLEPGDLLFFYGGQGAQHIAIYVGGDSIVHASSRSRRVKLDRLGGRGAHRTWFNERLIAVRRVAPVEGIFRLPAGGGAPPAGVATANGATASGDAAMRAVAQRSP